MTEPIAVIFLTFERTAYAVRSLQSLKDKLRYPDLRYYIADDGSRQDHITTILDMTKDLNMISWHTIPNGTYGRNANEAWQLTQQTCKLALFIEDDWELTQELDLYPYAALLMEREDVGMVRLGYLNLNMRGTVFGHGGLLYWRLDRECDPYVFTGHPSLRHTRYWNAYGKYPEGLLPGETELAYAYQFRKAQGPDIVYPVENGSYGKFAHIGEIKSY